MYKTLHKKQGSVTVQLRFARSSVTFCAKRDNFEIYAPQEYLSRAYHDAPRYCADIVSTQIKNDEVILKGEIPARCIQEYRNDLTYFTNGQGVCLTELKGYQPAIGKFICQPRRPNSRIDKVRHMFHKLA